MFSKIQKLVVCLLLLALFACSTSPSTEVSIYDPDGRKEYIFYPEKETSFLRKMFALEKFCGAPYVVYCKQEVELKDLLGLRFYVESDNTIEHKGNDFYTIVMSNGKRLFSSSSRPPGREDSYVYAPVEKYEVFVSAPKEALFPGSTIEIKEDTLSKNLSEEKMYRTSTGKKISREAVEGFRTAKKVLAVEPSSLEKLVGKARISFDELDETASLGMPVGPFGLSLSLSESDGTMPMISLMYQGSDWIFTEFVNLYVDGEKNTITGLTFNRNVQGSGSVSETSVRHITEDDRAILNKIGPESKLIVRFVGTRGTQDFSVTKENRVRS